MATIKWDMIGERFFETGVDRGVLYFPDGGGVPWSGLTSIEQKTSTSIESVYYDGVKFNDIVVAGDWSGTLRAYTYPEEFLEFEGIIAEQDGMYIAEQPQSLFHLSYRTRIGNDVDGVVGYKLHLLWNLTAIPATRTYESLSLETSPIEFEWSLTSIPEEVDKYRPTAHVILDSRKFDPLLLADLEDILYGTVDRPPTMPSLKGLTSFVRKWERIIIQDNGDGTWTATSRIDGFITMLDETTFQIDGANATYLDAETYELSSSEKNEEDI